MNRHFIVLVQFILFLFMQMYKSFVESHRLYGDLRVLCSKDAFLVVKSDRRCIFLGNALKTWPLTASVSDLFKTKMIKSLIFHDSIYKILLQLSS